MQKEKTQIKVANFISYRESVPEILDSLHAGDILSRQERILVKPNLVNATPPPVTTPVECCEAVIEYVRHCFDGPLVIAEGCGAADHETDLAFERLGYSKLSKRLAVPLIDLNHSPLTTVSCSDCEIFPQMHLPEIAFGSFIISVPVLKAHSLADITGTLKNMMGFAPPSYYQRGGHWKKAAFHDRMHESIVELNRYITPHLTLMDASVGLSEFHLGGAECNPPVSKLIAGCDPVETDRKAAELLGWDWRKIPHLKG